MRNFSFKLPVSFVSLCWGTVGTLTVLYIALIAIVMTYAALTVQFSQSVKNDEAAVAVLESGYLSKVSDIENSDYHALGYAVPTQKLFVPATSMTALR